MILHIKSLSGHADSTCGSTTGFGHRVLQEDDYGGPTCERCLDCLRQIQEVRDDDRFAKLFTYLQSYMDVFRGSEL